MKLCESTLCTTLLEIRKLQEQDYRPAWTRLDQLTKPPKSMGRIEELAAQIAAIQGTDRPKIETTSHIVCAGDHGVTAEGVSPFPSEVTVSMVANFANEGACVNQLAKVSGTKVTVIDVGVKSDTSFISGILQEKVRAGTGNMRIEPAMTIEELNDALMVGINVAIKEIEEGADMLSIGEMGIGNSTAAAAVVAAFTATPIAECVGGGTGLDSAGIALKAQVIKDSFARAKIKEGVAQGSDAMRVFSEIGGLEIAAMAGVILGGASKSVPVVTDGFIASAAVLLAHAINSASLDYVVFSHKSVEPGHVASYRFLHKNPLFSLDMRLGEGTGAVLAIPMIKAACKMLSDMATFEEAGITQ